MANDLRREPNPLSTNESVTRRLYDIGQLSLLGIGSPRHIRRLADSGRMPAPIKLGALLRWPSQTGDPLTGIHDWITAGCPDCRSLRRAAR
jgi:predicted DNA-binding transcriptional regulator AlpA